MNRVIKSVLNVGGFKMTPLEYYNQLIDRHKAYSWAAPIPYEQWLKLWWPTIERGLK